MNDEHFDIWNETKKRINKETKISHPKKYEIWWCRVGLNIGSEIYGKNKEYSRPVLVMNKGKNSVFLGAPLTTKLNKSSNSVIFQYKNVLQCANVLQMRVFDNRRVLKRMGKSKVEKAVFVDIRNIINALI